MDNRINITPGQGSLITGEYAASVAEQGGTMFPNIMPPVLDGYYKIGILEKSALILIPSATALDKLFYLNPKKNAGYFDTVRNSIATTVNWKKQVVEVPINTARIDYADGNPVMLLEPARTNLANQSEFTVVPPWAETGGVVFEDFDWSPQPLDKSAYFGDNTGGSATMIVKQNISLTQGDVYAVSFFIKMDDGGEPFNGIDFEVKIMNRFY